jgi:hypothetical protein
MPTVPSQEGRARVALRDIDEDTRSDGEPPPCLDVVPKRQFVARASRVVPIGTVLQDLGGALLEVGDRAGLETSRARS